MGAVARLCDDEPFAGQGFAVLIPSLDDDMHAAIGCPEDVEEIAGTEETARVLLEIERYAGADQSG